MRTTPTIAGSLLALVLASGEPLPGQSTIDSWRTTLPLPFPMTVADAFAYGDHIIALVPDFNLVLVGDVDPGTGDVTGWRSTLPIPPFGGLVSTGAAVVGTFIVVPGYPASAIGAVAADGTILGWTSGPGTNTPATGARAVAVDGDRIYVVGGGAPFVVFNRVETATLATDGTLGSWQELTPLPILSNDGLALVSDGYLIAFGGHSSTPGGDLSHANKVHRAPILADGTIGPWTFVGNLLERRTNGDHFLFDGTVHIVAGGVHSFMTSSVESVNAGSIGVAGAHAWSASLPTVLNEHAAVAVGRFGYVLGGNNRAFGGGPQSAVYVTELAEANQPPVADAGDDVSATTDASCVAAVVLDAGDSYDPDGDPLSFRWDGPGGPYTSSAVTLDLGPGNTTYTLTVDDGQGGSDQDEVSVEVIDSTPPIASASADPNLLWPPNHRMVEVSIAHQANDVCDPTPACSIVNVTANEPAGDQPDWEIVDGDTVLLRAERRASGSGRLYEVTVGCTDQAGNVANTVTTVAVPAGPVVLPATQDTFLRHGAPDTNEGGNDALRIQSSGKNRLLVGFDLSAVEPAAVGAARLELTIAELVDNWGANGRTVSAHRGLAPWSEGNGWTVGGNDRGDGPGATWACATDAEIANQSPDCPEHWNGGAFADATGPAVLHINGMTGVVAFDVTHDLLAGAAHGWVISKDSEGQSGKVFYISREGAIAVNQPETAPRLVIEYD